VSPKIVWQGEVCTFSWKKKGRSRSFCSKDVTGCRNCQAKTSITARAEHRGGKEETFPLTCSKRTRRANHRGERQPTRRRRLMSSRNNPREKGQGHAIASKKRRAPSAGEVDRHGLVGGGDVDGRGRGRWLSTRRSMGSRLKKEKAAPQLLQGGGGKKRKKGLLGSPWRKGHQKALAGEPLGIARGEKRLNPRKGGELENRLGISNE